MAARSEPRSGSAAPSPPRRRGRYFTIPQAAQAYSGVLTERLIRRLGAERCVAYSYAGRRVMLAEEADIEAYLDANRQEPLQGLTAVGATGRPSRAGVARSRRV